MPAVSRTKIRPRKYALSTAPASSILLVGQMCGLALVSTAMARKKKAREVGSAGGINSLPYMSGVPNEYATISTTEINPTTHANRKANCARLGFSAEEKRVTMMDNARTKKQNAVIGDM